MASRARKRSSTDISRVDAPIVGLPFQGLLPPELFDLVTDRGQGIPQLLALGEVEQESGYDHECEPIYGRDHRTRIGRNWICKALPGVVYAVWKKVIA
jgi:hypothetical protein